MGSCSPSAPATDRIAPTCEFNVLGVPFGSILLTTLNRVAGQWRARSRCPARINDGLHGPRNAYRIRWPHVCATVSAVVLFTMFAANSSAQPRPLYDGADGATCDYFNLGARIAWRHKQGDWRDALGSEQGNVSFAQTLVRSGDTNRAVRWNVTSLVQGWLVGAYPNAGMLIAGVRGPARGPPCSTAAKRRTRSFARRLVIELPDRTTRRLVPIADTTLACSTVYSIGSQDTLTAGDDRKLLIQFDLDALKGSRIAKATLEMTTTDHQYGDTMLGVFRLDPPIADPKLEEKPRYGLAALYPDDRNIERDPDVIMATGFDSPLWMKDWSYVDVRGSLGRTGGDASALGFNALSGQALQVRIPRGKHLGLDLRYRFADKLGEEPEEIYFRYYLRLASDWNPTTDGGKLPGISGTYGKAGWGGRPSEGNTGWSLRGGFFRQPEAANPYRDFTPIGNLCVSPRRRRFLGRRNGHGRSGRHGLLERNRWYCIEQYLKLNQPGHKDAVFRVWVDGRLAVERDGFRVRDVDSIRIEQIWMNVYYGGGTPSPQDQHLFIDNVVIARRYIGPMTGSVVIQSAPTPGKFCMFSCATILPSGKTHGGDGRTTPCAELRTQDPIFFPNCMWLARKCQ